MPEGGPQNNPPKQEGLNIKPFSTDFVKAQIEKLLGSVSVINTVRSVEVTINPHNQMRLDLAITAKGFDIRVTAVLVNKGDSLAALEEPKVEGHFLVRGFAKEAIKPHVDNVGKLLKDYIEKTENQKVEKIEIKNGQLEVTFEKKADAVVQKENKDEPPSAETIPAIEVENKQTPPIQTEEPKPVPEKPKNTSTVETKKTKVAKKKEAKVPKEKDQQEKTEPKKENTKKENKSPQIETHTIKDFEQAVVGYLRQELKDFKDLINFKYEPEDTDVFVEVFYKNNKGGKSSVKMSAAQVFEQSLNKEVSQAVMFGNNFLITFMGEAEKDEANSREGVDKEFKNEIIPDKEAEGGEKNKSEKEIELEKLLAREAEIDTLRAELLRRLEEIERNKK